jgi:hypothetical protein
VDADCVVSEASGGCGAEDSGVSGSVVGGSLVGGSEEGDSELGAGEDGAVEVGGHGLGEPLGVPVGPVGVPVAVVGDEAQGVGEDGDVGGVVVGVVGVDTLTDGLGWCAGGSVFWSLSPVSPWWRENQSSRSGS